MIDYEKDIQDSCMKEYPNYDDVPWQKCVSCYCKNDCGKENPTE